MVVGDVDSRVDDPESPIWYCVGPRGVVRGHFTMSFLKRWKESSLVASNFKVWKKGQSEAEAIFLSDAVRHLFPDWVVKLIKVLFVWVV